ncbi:class I SAM-dependent methyltransferase [Phyllobacterium salinisoli]|uniref:Class I SAM-dependent methyltransferase n=1 Tax=Phyllobacterium salinisoli TaxID=1899321 RepID=A0A368K857_9HYPH|nr:class I SAM-dependent methyltransferase [Phyllobacterium salinisoli]RCS25546.1 class I SAM-dependent methyltransferase [Phyllobacterium salinisoli]
MTALKQRLVRLIDTAGPISVAEYMAACLGDREAGYYTTREPFGREGDFITAPEVSQMFGELVGIWCAGVWQALGQPQNAVLCEIGPGRGTLMADMLRTLAKVAPAFLGSARVAMVETSQRLTEIQQKKLAGAVPSITWHREIEDVPEGPLILVANELFDALPVRQYVKVNGRFVERLVTTMQTADGTELGFSAGAGSIDAALLPPRHAQAPDGAIFEAAPARTALMQRIAERIAASRGAALLIDYGHLETGFGDTLQAVSKHKPQGVFEKPGEADLTSHVDFAALADTARAFACRTGAMTQGDFLLAMGLLDRAGQLGADKNEAYREQIRTDVERLAGPGQMGTLFKVLCVSDQKSRIFPFDPSV